MAIDINKLAEIGTMAAGGGYAQAALGGAQAVYGLTQLPKAKAEFERAKAAAPSLETPAQFYENYKNAYDGEMARMQNDAIQSNLATSVQALQGAGGRALVGGLNQATAQSQSAQNSMLAQERQMRMAAGQQLASAEERTVGRKEARSQQEQAYANQAYQAALGNIGSGLGAAGEGLMYGLSAAKGGNANEASPDGAVRDVEKEGFNKKTIEDTEKLQDELEINEENDIQSEEEAEVSEDFVGNLASLEDSKNQQAARNEKAKILPRINTRLQSSKAMRQTKVGDIGGVGSSAFAAKAMPSFSPEQPAQQLRGFTAPPPGFSSLGPEGGSAIPAQYRNTQAMKQIQALGKAYSAFKPFVDSMGKFRNGGMLTDGAFDHASNPIDLVQNGQVVGEATGGEYILNPEQAAAIAKQSAFAKNLFKKFEKNAKKKK